jgi:hypothetical protein
MECERCKEEINKKDYKLLSNIEDVYVSRWAKICPMCWSLLPKRDQFKIKLTYSFFTICDKKSNL